jgi:hypothetical protein
LYCFPEGRQEGSYSTKGLLFGFVFAMEDHAVEHPEESNKDVNNQESPETSDSDQEEQAEGNKTTLPDLSSLQINNITENNNNNNTSSPSPRNTTPESTLALLKGNEKEQLQGLSELTHTTFSFVVVDLLTKVLSGSSKDIKKAVLQMLVRVAEKDEIGNHQLPIKSCVGPLLLNLHSYALLGNCKRVIITNEKFFAKLLKLLTSKSADVQELAANAMWNVLKGSQGEHHNNTPHARTHLLIPTHSLLVHQSYQ